MNYLHSYHAGNFADIFKHTILITLIHSLAKKENGFCYLDTHAGTGYYDLYSKEANKSKEFESGIIKLLQAKNPPPLIKEYLACVQEINQRFTPVSTNELRYYPGSPAIMKYFLRPQDRMVLTELHSGEYEKLKRFFPHYKKIGVHLLNGYHALKAFLPPKEHRGLILIDPPYEESTEWVDITAGLESAIKRFETGVYAIWYPIKNRLALERFQKTLKEKIKRPILITELMIYPEVIPTHLSGCGMIIVNPPWQLDQQLKEFLPFLKKLYFS